MIVLQSFKADKTLTALPPTGGLGIFGSFWQYLAVVGVFLRFLPFMAVLGVVFCVFWRFVAIYGRLIPFLGCFCGCFWSFLWPFFAVFDVFGGLAFLAFFGKVCWRFLALLNVFF